MSDHPMMAPPRQLDDVEQAERAEHCYELHTRIVSALGEGRSAMWRACEALHEFDEEAGWTALGGYETLNEWLADPEVQLKKDAYYRMLRAYRETVVRRGIPMATVETIDFSKVDVVSPRVKSGEVSIEEALSDAQELGWRDLREKYIKRPDAVPGVIDVSAVPDVDSYDGEDDDSVAAQQLDDSEPQSQNGVAEGAENEPTQNAVGVLSTFPLGQRVATFLVWVQAEMAPEHKKRMGADRRATLQALIEACRDEGWLDAE
jgi:hypothetical protein